MERSAVNSYSGWYLRRAVERNTQCRSKAEEGQSTKDLDAFIF
jgi:hypothetical protein